jgi:hypothetical protein
MNSNFPWKINAIMRYKASFVASGGDEIVGLGVLVERMGESVQGHVPGAVPGDSLLFWAEKDLVGSER